MYSLPRGRRLYRQQGMLRDHLRRENRQFLSPRSFVTSHVASANVILFEAHARHPHSPRSSRTGYILYRTTGGPAPF